MAAVISAVVPLAPTAVAKRERSVVQSSNFMPVSGVTTSSSTSLLTTRVHKEGKMEAEISPVVPLAPTAVAKREIRRPVAEFHPSVWGDYFLTHSPPTQKIPVEEIRERVEELVRQVKKLLVDRGDLLQELHLIDALQRLGVAYRFEKEINEALDRINDAKISDESSLHAVSLWFRLLRQHGYRVSSAVFKRFTEKDGKFKTALACDARGMLSLYEAAYLGTPGEDILDEAITFTRTHLKSIVNQLELPLSTLVSDALQTPLSRRITRLEARGYISIYQDYKELRNDVVLELAKLDYHLLQLLHWEEVRSITKWMNNLGLMKKLAFARDRVVEIYFLMVGLYYEPCYSRGRIIMTKVMCMNSLMDDLFDSYGTLEELIGFDDAIQRWNLEAAHQLPEYFNDVFMAMFVTLKEIEDELRADAMSYRISYLKNQMKSLSRAYLVEVKWREENYVPSVEEHLKVSLISSGNPLFSCVSYVGMGEEATKETFDWVVSFPKIVESSSLVCRLMNDIVTQEFEQKREHAASTVESYMKEHGTSRSEACKKIKEMIENGWKIINQHSLRPSPIPKSLMMPVINVVRVIEAMYQYGTDGYTQSSTFSKDQITLALVEPISI